MFTSSRAIKFLLPTAVTTQQRQCMAPDTPQDIFLFPEAADTQITDHLPRPDCPRKQSREWLRLAAPRTTLRATLPREPGAWWHRWDDGVSSLSFSPPCYLFLSILLLSPHLCSLQAVSAQFFLDTHPSVKRSSKLPQASGKNLIFYF